MNEATLKCKYCESTNGYIKRARVIMDNQMQIIPFNLIRWFLKSWLSILLFIVGLVPYLALTYLTALEWTNFIGEPFNQATRTVDLIQEIFLSLSIFGSYFLWIIFCRFFKYTYNRFLGF